jgi:hypothetical protein
MREVIAGVAIATLVVLAGCTGRTDADSKTDSDGVSNSRSTENGQKVDITNR